MHGSEYVECDGGAGFSIGQGMMVKGKVVAAGCSYGVKLVVGQRLAELSAGCYQCVIEQIVGVVHLIHPEGSS